MYREKSAAFEAIFPGVIRIADSADIPADPENIDWQAYQQWRSEGNTPEPAA